MDQVLGGTNIQLDPLLTFDGHILAGSPCVDYVPTSSATEDFEGDPRPTGSGYDCGADELVTP